ncbi:MAG: hypothetical protein F6K35_47460 [Okeania sp. SIO2H7]|nr:hypothetical protein [Okeania sp. SIO2H7]
MKRWCLPTHHVLETKSEQWSHRSDRRNTLNHSFFALGCARAGLDILEQAASRSPALPRLKSVWMADQQLKDCRQDIYHAQTNIHSPNSDGMNGPLCK